MNILDILIVVVLGFSLCAGLYKGFLSSLLATAALVGSWFGARAIYARVADIALSNTTLVNAMTNYLEPSTFFEDGGSALVSNLSGNTVQIANYADTIGKKIPFLRDAFETNLVRESFQGLNLNTVADYFGRTLWEGVFNVLAFIVCFALIYAVALLLINLLDHVFRFPLLTGIDWLLGGVCGLIRGLVIVMLIVVIAMPIVSVFVPEFTQTLIDGSKLYGFISSMDFLKIGSTISKLVGA